MDSKDKTHIDVTTKYAIFAPDSYNADFSVNPYYLTRGIFKVPVFNGNNLSLSPIKYDSISPFTTSVYYTLSKIDLKGMKSLSGKIDFQGGENI